MLLIAKTQTLCYEFELNKSGTVVSVVWSLIEVANAWIEARTRFIYIRRKDLEPKRVMSKYHQCALECRNKRLGTWATSQISKMARFKESERFSPCVGTGKQRPKAIYFVSPKKTCYSVSDFSSHPSPNDSWPQVWFRVWSVEHQSWSTSTVEQPNRRELTLSHMEMKPART